MGANGSFVGWRLRLSSCNRGDRSHLTYQICRISTRLTSINRVWPRECGHSGCMIGCSCATPNWDILRMMRTTLVISFDVYVSYYMTVAQIKPSDDFWHRNHSDWLHLDIEIFRRFCSISFVTHRIAVDIHRVFWSSQCCKLDYNINYPFPIILG